MYKHIYIYTYIFTIYNYIYTHYIYIYTHVDSDVFLLGESLRTVGLMLIFF